MADNQVPPLVQRARKAFNAGVWAAAAAFGTGLTAEVPKTRTGWIGLVTASLGFGVAAGVSTFLVRNVGAVAGSDPPPAHRAEAR
jgi:hypothetical protein